MVSFFAQACTQEQIKKKYIATLREIGRPSG